jgi:hypothetical protein
MTQDKSFDFCIFPVYPVSTVYPLTVQTLFNSLPPEVKNTRVLGIFYARVVIMKLTVAGIIMIDTFLRLLEKKGADLTGFLLQISKLPIYSRQKKTWK